VGDWILWNEFRVTGQRGLLAVSTVFQVLVLVNNAAAVAMCLPQKCRELPPAQGMLLVCLSLFCPEVISIAAQLVGEEPAPRLRAFISAESALEDIPGLAVQIVTISATGWTPAVIISMVGTLANLVLRGLNAAITLVASAGRHDEQVEPHPRYCGEAAALAVLSALVNVGIIVCTAVLLHRGWHSSPDGLSMPVMVGMLGGAAALCMAVRLALLASCVYSCPQQAWDTAVLLDTFHVSGLISVVSVCFSPYGACVLYRRRPHEGFILSELITWYLPVVAFYARLHTQPDFRMSDPLVGTPFVLAVIATVASTAWLLFALASKKLRLGDDNHFVVMRTACWGMSTLAWLGLLIASCWALDKAGGGGGGDMAAAYIVTVTWLFVGFIVTFFQWAVRFQDDPATDKPAVTTYTCCYMLCRLPAMIVWLVLLPGIAWQWNPITTAGLVVLWFGLSVCYDACWGLTYHLYPSSSRQAAAPATPRTVRAVVEYGPGVV